MLFRARHCAACGLGFPVQADSTLGAQCPACGAPTAWVGEAYATHEIPRTDARASAAPVVQALLDNVRSVRNVGSIFRTADGAGVAHLHLAGFTPTPEHPQMPKTALGAERSVPWTHHPDPVAAAAALVDAGHRLWALEGGAGATDMFELVMNEAPNDDRTIVLVLGHEVSGVDPRIVRQCERVASLPMAGIKGSLNVGVAFGVAAYVLRHQPRYPASDSA